MSAPSSPQHRAFASSSARDSVVALILADHRKAEQLFQQYHSTRDLAEKQKAAWALIKEISVHGAKEEMSIYPYMKKNMPETARKIDHSLEEHQTLKEDLAKLDSMTIENPQFDATIQRVWKDLTHHIGEEERDILPKLEATATAAELVSLGETFSRVEMIAPTRPHPNAPAEGAAAVAANMGAKVVDKVRDAEREREKEEL
jgi:hemerythrin superfamily protein